MVKIGASLGALTVLPNINVKTWQKGKEIESLN